MNAKCSTIFHKQFGNKFVAHTIALKQQNGSEEVRINNGEWKKLNVSTIASDASRFSLKCSLDGVISTFSAVITPDQIDIFNEVMPFFLLSVLTFTKR